MIPLAGRSEIGRDDMAPREHREEKGWELEDDEEFLAAWDRTEAAAVDLLRKALPEVAGASFPAEALREGASAEPEALVGYIDACPEIDGNVDPDDASLVETAFELVLPAWEAAGAVDEGHRLTPLGLCGLPRALAWAWSGVFDRGADERS